ncbi:MAG: diguanylate cyclase (GGDEF)-like protein [Alphaproteobacteria bacterium]|jgi:diguanylate cyclase (GGDEF)-like protein
MKHCDACTSKDAQLIDAKAEIKRQEALIQTLYQQIEDEKRTTPLTGLPNKLSMKEHTEEAIATAGRYVDRINVMFFTDLDNFKGINDNYNHTFGDDVLKAVAKTYKSTLRAADHVFHISGDEFIILAEVENLEDAEKVKAKIQNAIDALELNFNGEVVKLGVSVGYTEVYAKNSVKDLTVEADESLQADKDKRLKDGLRHKRT